MAALPPGVRAAGEPPLGLKGPAADAEHVPSPLLQAHSHILDSMVEGAMVADASGRIVIANEAAARIFGVGRPELLDVVRNYSERFTLRSDDGADAPIPLATRALAGEIVEPVERRIRTPDGLEKHLRASAAPVRDGTGAIVGAVVLTADISAAKAAQARAAEHASALESAYREAQEAIRNRDEVLAVVSHDLRAPLGVITLGAASLIRHLPNERARKTAESVLRAADRLRRLIDDLVTVARSRGGALALQPREVSPLEILTELVESFGPLAAERHVTLRQEAITALPVIRCDPDRVLEALSNYAGNAFSVVPAGGVITASLETVGEEVWFSVTDDGPGIAPADLLRVFDRYYRGSAASYQGSGLGLAIAKAIAIAHGGRAWADSRQGRGSTFYLALPHPAPSKPAQDERVGA